eukprot:TRINITY_DN64397_c0_g1_i1.p2 TRINITY_DN64397_c0_g1~~TRINITY_DN64397_c0_g1_i1.p2  ORF type:complete len:369 (-),score=98.70 TRINITY_DN64397_c0_g1_i1:65-1135(-)
MDGAFWGGPLQDVVVDPDALAAQLGLQLNDESRASLATLPPQHVSEFLQSLARKVAIGTVGNPNNYICATIRRGYTPNDAYHAQKGKGCWKGGAAFGGGGGDVGMGMGVGGGCAPAATVLESIKKAQAAGVPLTEEASSALLQAPMAHAAEILDYVAERAQEIRDPSNYIVATLARGYMPRGEKGDKGKGKDKKGGFVDAMGIPQKRPMPRLLPVDASPLELKVVELNCECLWGEQQFDISTLLALRCIPMPQAIQLIDSFANKARSMKGKGKGIADINNYIQATVAKIQRGGEVGKGGDGGCFGDGGFGVEFNMAGFGGDQAFDPTMQAFEPIADQYAQQGESMEQMAKRARFEM